MTTAELLVPPHYAACLELGRTVLPAAPIYGPDIDPGGPNAEAKLEGGRPYIRWRSDYPSPAMDEPTRQREIKRTARHEVGHPFEWLLAIAIAAKKGWTYEVALEYVHRRYFEFRGFTGTWEGWALNEPWKAPREGFADCFGAAVSLEWIVAVGSSQGDRNFNEGKTVTAAAARTWFEGMVTEAVGATLPGVAVDYPSAIWYPSPNRLPGGNAMTHIVDHWTVGSLASALTTLTMPGGFSAHYIIDRVPPFAIYQLVREGDRAFHDSSPGWNEKGIGIEHVHFDEDAAPGIQQEWPSLQLEASAALHRSISRRRGIPLDGDHVKGHGNTYPVFTTECPGDLPINRLMEDYLNMEITETRLREIIREESTVPISTKLNAGFGLGLNHKLRRLARYLGRANGGIAQDPGGVGGTDTVGYPIDNTPLA